nr:hypothetical protein [Pseudomonas sp. NFPP33]
MTGLASNLILNMSVRKKLLSGFGLILVITLCIAGVSYGALDNTLGRFEILLKQQAITGSPGGEKLHYSWRQSVP